jgi:hypothetical protein
LYNGLKIVPSKEPQSPMSTTLLTNETPINLYTQSV